MRDARTLTRSTIAAAAVAAVLALVVLAAVVPSPALEREAIVRPSAATQPAAELQPGFLYGRVNTLDGATFEGRLRWGGDQEAFWGDYFNGTKMDNPWAAHAPGAQPAKERRSFEIFGFRIGDGDDPASLRRPFMARVGDIARVEVQFRHVRVTLKSGTAIVLDRFQAGDIDDGVRVWDDTRGVVDVDTRRIRTIDFLPTPPMAPAGSRLHGTVRTRHGDFTGFIQWDRRDCVGSDTLDGRGPEGKVSVRYDTIRQITRRSRDSARVTLVDGREVELSGTREVGRENFGVYVDDRRYGRVLVSWDAFESVEFTPADSGPAYDDFPPGRPLVGTVTTRDGRRLAGRLVYDFDESETTETLDAPSEGVDYTLPFALVASIALPGPDARDPYRAVVTLRNGEQLRLQRAGDLGEGNAGMLVFVDGRERPEYVAWADVERVEFNWVE